MEIKQLSYKYGKKSPFVLHGINCKINKNITYITGANGSGKTTLINLINLLDKPSLGEITFDDFSLNNKSKYGKIYKNRNKINLVFQFSDNQIVGINVKEELLFNNNRNKNQLIKEIDIYLRQFKLDKKILNKNPLNLSQGEKKKISIIAILLRKPKILLLDEPLCGIDNGSKKNIMDVIQNYSKTNTVIIISHNYTEIFEYATNVIELKDGKILMSTSVSDFFYTKYKNKKISQLPEYIQYITMYNLGELEFKKIKNKKDVLNIIKDKHDLFKKLEYK